MKKKKFLEGLGLLFGIFIVINIVFIVGVAMSMKPSYTFFTTDEARIDACRSFGLKDNAEALYVWRRGRDEKGIRVQLKSNSIAAVQSQFDLPVLYSSESGAVEVFTVPYRTSADVLTDCAQIEVDGLYDKIGPHEVYIVPEKGEFFLEIDTWH